MGETEEFHGVRKEKPDLTKIMKEELQKVRDYPFLNRCGKRLESNKVIVRQTKNGQFHTTIPKAIAKAMGLQKGSILKFDFQAYGGVKIVWKNPDSETYKRE